MVKKVSSPFLSDNPEENVNHLADRRLVDIEMDLSQETRSGSRSHRENEWRSEKENKHISGNVRMLLHESVRRG